MDEIAHAAGLMVPALPDEGDIEAAVAAAVNEASLGVACAPTEDNEITEEPKKRIHRAKSLTAKQALTKFWSRGIYVILNEDLDVDANITSEEVKRSKYTIRCRCSPTCKTSFASWDAYAYNRHFTYKKHVKWEATRDELGWDEGVAYREFVKFMEMTYEDQEEEEEDEEEEVEPPKKRGRKSQSDAAGKKKAKKSKTPGNNRSEERRQQEMHYMSLWRLARAELKVMRQQLKVETIQESIDELNIDMAGLRRKKDEWARLLGIEGVEM